MNGVPESEGPSSTLAGIESVTAVNNSFLFKLHANRPHMVPIGGGNAQRTRDKTIEAVQTARRLGK